MTGNLKRKPQTARAESVGASHVFESIEEGVRALGGGGRGKEPPNSREITRRYSIIERLLGVSASINSILNLDDVLREIVDAVVQITGGNRGLLMLRDEKTGGLVAALGRSKDGRDTPRDAFDVSLSVVRKVAESGEPLFITNTLDEADLKDQKSIVDLRIVTVICIPLRFVGKLVGVIYSDSDTVSESFSESDLSILNAFGAQAAVAIENAKRHGELETVKRALETQNVVLREELSSRYEYSGMVGRSPSMQRIFDMIRKIAPLSTTVLIQGETGTGKELIAKAIHYNGARKARPIVSINCGALPRDILESELFGYRKGAFTGAEQDRAGLFEAADGGTMFLDEIGDMSVDLQVKLLRVLQEGEVRRLGDEFSRSVDVRVISATNRDLAREVEAGNFRRDLFYRLNVVPICVPPLRERQEDILPLVDFFLTKFSTEMKKTKPTLSRDAKELLLQHEWKGNVRELENAIERALALAEGRSELGTAQFDQLARSPLFGEFAEGEDSLKSKLLIWEKEIIQKMLITHSWNISQTAAALKISRQQLHSKIRRHKISPII
jgi:transcriptional regulator with GAF, ATPase, and Fis domain